MKLRPIESSTEDSWTNPGPTHGPCPPTLLLHLTRTVWVTDVPEKMVVEGLRRRRVFRRVRAPHTGGRTRPDGEGVDGGSVLVRGVGRSLFTRVRKLL